MVRRQIARGVADTIGRETDGERAAQPTAALAARLEALEMEAGIGRRSAEEIIDAIVRYLGPDPARMTLRPPLPDAISMAEADAAAPLIEDRQA